jgi:hypothetical protein
MLAETVIRGQGEMNEDVFRSSCPRASPVLNIGATHWDSNLKYSVCQSDVYPVERSIDPRLMNAGLEVLGRVRGGTDGERCPAHHIGISA